MDTALFSTRTDFRLLDYPSNDKGLAVGIDIGYSSVKSVSRTGVTCFPSFVTKLTSKLFGELDANEIVYTDEETSQRYCVGDFATSSLSKGQYITEKTFYDRNHYMTPEFLAQFRCGLAMGLWKEKEIGKVYVQTGLPPAYLNDDEPILRHSLEGRHYFTVQKGSEKRTFDITIDGSQLDIMVQPMGTLYSVSMTDKADFTAELTSYLRSNVLIFDGGFGTLDLFSIRNKRVESVDTKSDLGMRRVLDETRNLIREEHGIDISIPEMQTCLKTGRAIKRDVINKSTKAIDISGYLKDANRKVCEEAFESISNYIFDTDYLIMTGGCGAAWYHWFCEKLKDVGTLKVLSGNMMSNLPYIYANARGYFMYLTATLKRRK